MKFFKKILSVFLILTVSIPVIAQPSDPCVDPFDYCPIDDNVYFLILAVILIAGYKYLSIYLRKEIVK